LNLCISQLNRTVWQKSQKHEWWGQVWRDPPGENISQPFKPFLRNAIDYWIERSHKNPDWEAFHESSEWNFEEVEWFRDTRIKLLPKLLTFDKMFDSLDDEP
jgi:hypothetical protein